jgi:pyruvate dehydrogenase E1 component beta subunit
VPLITYREAIRHALAEELDRDPNVVVMGEEVAQFNGAYKVTEGLLAKFGPKRIVDTPISEAGFIGMGIGASMLGVRPVMELMFWSFYSVAFDQILNNAANVRYMSGGQINCPIVIRGPANGGTNVGATHSHTPENVLANHPGREGRRPRPRLRRQGPAQVRHPRQRPRVVPREHHALR